MCSLANFSKELLRKDISKMSLGFIAGLDGKAGLHAVFIRFSIVIGDDPALYRFAGVKEGNALRSCIRLFI